jgi:hypothetical protein
MHGLVALFLEVIMLAIILLVVGLVAPHVQVVASRAIVALIVSMMIVGLPIIAVASVASMIVEKFTTAMLMVDGSLIHGYVRQEVELFLFPLAACPWQSSQEHQPPCRLLDTA